MTIPLTMQCARVANLHPNHVEPHSAKVKCSMCREAVWISRPARSVADLQTVTPICDVCKPANVTGPVTPG